MRWCHPKLCACIRVGELHRNSFAVPQVVLREAAVEADCRVVRRRKYSAARPPNRNAIRSSLLKVRLAHRVSFSISTRSLLADAVGAPFIMSLKVTHAFR